jgi:hypothetical protein
VGGSLATQLRSSQRGKGTVRCLIFKMELKRTNQFTAIEVGIRESDIEKHFLENSESLNLGGVEILSSQILQVHGGILDLLAFDKESNTYYEIEIMRGPADHWHIGHVLDYWAKEKRTKQFSYHVAVLITESCRGRYKTLLSTLPSFIPIIIMELRFIKVDSSVDHYIRCEPIYYPDNINFGLEDRMYVKGSSGFILASKTSMLLIAHLLSNQKLITKSMRDISSLTGVSLGAVGNIVKALSEKNYVEQSGKKRKLSNEKELKGHFLQILRAFPDRANYIKENSKLDISKLRENEQPET